MAYDIAMKQAKKPVQQTKNQQEKENLKILGKFFKESTVIMETAIEESHRKHPDLLKSSN
jgi:hypothetical protein